MSELWGYYCQTCKQESADEWINRGEKELREYWALRRMIKLASLSFDTLTITPTGYEDFEPMMNSFFLGHWEHDVFLRNEYGKFKPMAGEEASLTICAECEHHKIDEARAVSLDHWRHVCTAIALMPTRNLVTGDPEILHPDIYDGQYPTSADFVHRPCAKVNNGACDLFEPLAEAEVT